MDVQRPDVLLEVDILEYSVIENETSIEEKGWLHHRVIEHVIWIRLELIQLGEHNTRMGAIECSLRTRGENDASSITCMLRYLNLVKASSFSTIGP